MARQLLAKGGTLESGIGTTPVNEEHLSVAVETHILDQMATNLGEPGPSLTAKTAAAEILASVKSALNKTAGGAGASALTDLEVASLEAIVQVTGRPAMRYKDGQVEMPSELGENARWRVLVATARANINRASASIGRVEITGSHGGGMLLGTAWRLGENYVVTNRHVAAYLVIDSGKATAEWKLDLTKAPCVDFGIAVVGGPKRRFAVEEISYCAPEKEIDLAILKLERGLITAPPALTVDMLPESLGYEVASTTGRNDSFKGEPIYVVGHPYGPPGSEAISAVFGSADGSKRWSPGFVTSIEEQDPVLEHDCSTLGGNSGSCVLTTSNHAVVGLHFGGRGVDSLSGLGTANVALALSRLGDNPAAKILRSGKI